MTRKTPSPQGYARRGSFRHASATWAVVLVLSALGSARGQMPDLRTMSGRPLPSADLPAGTVTVRVARQIPVNAVVGAEVTAVIGAPNGEARKRTVTTGSDGRATFEGVGPGSTFQAEVTVDEERLQTTSFTVPPQGGTRVMLIAGLEQVPAEGQTAGGAPQPHEAPFTLGAVAGSVAPADGLAPGVLELALSAPDRPLADQDVSLGQVGADNTVRVLRARSGADGIARFEGLATGEGTGYAAVIQHEGMRLGTEAFRMPADKGMRGMIKALPRTNDPSVLGVDARSKVIVDLREDAVAVMEQLVFTNKSDRLFDPGPDGLLIPLPEGFKGAQELGGGVPLKLKEDEGFLLQTPVPPDKAALFAVQARFGFVMPADGASRLTVHQPLPFGMQTPLLLVPAHTGLSLEASGIRAQPPGKDSQDDPVNMYELPTIGPGGTLSLTVVGLPARSARGRWVAAVMCLLLLSAAVVGIRRPRGPARADHDPTRLSQRREVLFSELVAVERQRREGRGVQNGVLEERRRELLSKLETVYRELDRVEQGESAPR